MLNTEELLNDIRTLLNMEYDFVNVISFYTGFYLKYGHYRISEVDHGIEISKKCFIYLFGRSFCIDFEGDNFDSWPLGFEFSIKSFCENIMINTHSRAGPNKNVNRNIDVAAAFELLSDSQKLFYLKNLDIFKIQ